MQWGMDLVPGHWSKLGRYLVLGEVKNPPFRSSIPLISFICCQLSLLPRQTLEGILLQNATEDSDLPVAKKQWLLFKAFLGDVAVSVPAKLAS